MNKKQLVDTIQSSLNEQYLKDKKNKRLTKADVEDVINRFIAVTSKEMQKGGDVTLVGFGRFYVKHIKSRKGINPQTRDKIEIPARNSAAFKPGNNLRSL